MGRSVSGRRALGEDIEDQGRQHVRGVGSGGEGPETSADTGDVSLALGFVAVRQGVAQGHGQLHAEVIVELGRRHEDAEPLEGRARAWVVPALEGLAVVVDQGHDQAQAQLERAGLVAVELLELLEQGLGLDRRGAVGGPDVGVEQGCGEVLLEVQGVEVAIGELAQLVEQGAAQGPSVSELGLVSLLVLGARVDVGSESGQVPGVDVGVDQHLAKNLEHDHGSAGEGDEVAGPRQEQCGARLVPTVAGARVGRREHVQVVEAQVQDQRPGVGALGLRRRKAGAGLRVGVWAAVVVVRGEVGERV